MTRIENLERLNLIGGDFRVHKISGRTCVVLFTSHQRRSVHKISGTNGILLFTTINGGECIRSVIHGG